MSFGITSIWALLVGCNTDISIVDEDQDHDQDGYLSPADCDDENPNLHPNKTESCNGVDDNCDDQIDNIDASAGEEYAYYKDEDADGYAADNAIAEYFCSEPNTGFYTKIFGDCDDFSSAVNPAQNDENCDGIDNNCNDVVDEEGGQTYFYDRDFDDYGNANDTIKNCVQPFGTVTDSADCNDAHPQIYPNAPELCDELDNDCDGLIAEENNGPEAQNWFLDADSDGYGSQEFTTSCAVPDHHVSDSSDCNDNAAHIHPGAEETCNGLDDDCDPQTNENEFFGITWFYDEDQDGYGSNANSEKFCLDPPSGFVSYQGDCDDQNASVNEFQTEVCSDGLDNDCRVSHFCGFSDPDHFATNWGVSFQNESEGFGRYGHDLEWIDFNADGLSDLVVSEPDRDAGRVHLFDRHDLNPPMQNSTPTSVATGIEMNTQFGEIISGAGDLNLDGFTDLAVYSPGTQTISLHFGNEYFDLENPLQIHLPNPELITNVDFKSGDINADQKSDLGILINHQNGVDVHMIPGAQHLTSITDRVVDLSAISTHYYSDSQSRNADVFLHMINVDQGATQEVILAEPNDNNNTGRIAVISAPSFIPPPYDATRLRILAGQEPGDFFGSGLTYIQGQGAHLSDPDLLIVTAPGDASVYTYSMPLNPNWLDQTPPHGILKSNASTFLGEGVSELNDGDQDGVRELLISAPVDSGFYVVKKHLLQGEKILEDFRNDTLLISRSGENQYGRVLATTSEGVLAVGSEFREGSGGMDLYFGLGE